MSKTAPGYYHGPIAHRGAACQSPQALFSTTGEVTMKAVPQRPERIDRLFSTGEARLDRWYKLTFAAQAWAAKHDEGGRTAVEAAFAELRPAESFFGYPGLRLLRAIEDEIAQDDAGDIARLVQRIYNALMSKSYGADAADWETTDDATNGVAGVRLLPTQPAQRGRGGQRRSRRDMSPPGVLRSRGTPRNPSQRHRGRGRAVRDPLLRQPQALRPASDRHVPRSAHRPRQIDLQVELDPRHGRVLRPDVVPRRILGNHRRPRLAPRAHRQHQARPGHGGPRLRLRPRVLRHQRHVDVQQDGRTGAPGAG